MAGRVVRVSRFATVFELYNPAGEIRLSEALQNFRIFVASENLYSGRAVVRSLIHTGPAVIVCEVTLEAGDWIGIDYRVTGQSQFSVRAEYENFLREWQKLYLVHSEYKLVLADMETYFAEFSHWLNRMELSGHGAAGKGIAPSRDRHIVRELADAAVATLTALFERFERAASGVRRELIPAHRILAMRQLHPLLLCSPFFNRCYVKPLGYAGDYEMINMMMRDPCEGDSLFAKVMNHWFLSQPPVRAHRNRIDLLTGYIVQMARRKMDQDRAPRVLSLGCGPAHEIQRFLAEQPSNAEFTLLDFNEETLQHVRSVMESLRAKLSREAQFHYLKKSVHQMLKEASKAVEAVRNPNYDFIYCAGLFDYLSDPVCRRLMDLMYEWLRPGGLLVATNVHKGNPSIGWMELLVDWHLIYRDSQQMAALAPKASSPDECRVVVEETGVNVFLEVSRPKHA